MHIQSAMLISDWLIYILAFATLFTLFWMRKQPQLRDAWRQVLHRKLGMVALVVLLFYVIIGLLDSVHLRITTKMPNGNVQTSQVMSLFDIIVSPLGQQPEKTYSAPFATHLYSQAIVVKNDKEIRAYPRLKYGGAHLENPKFEKRLDIMHRVFFATLFALISFVFFAGILLWFLSYRHHENYRHFIGIVLKGKSTIAWREALLTFAIIWLCICITSNLATSYHIFGTDRVGQDVFYEALKSIRTGLLIGTLTTIFMLPFALILGIVAGYFRGWIDDAIQYLYTTLSSIPGVLLISATILVMQVYIASHPELFPTLMQRADARLLALCLILGITSWASLCRLLRAETLKLRDFEYVQAAKVLGVRSRKILFRHIAPNVMHIVLITIVIDFSGLVLAEAVLSYVGVGVDPTTMSWGNMINSSRLELAREPIVWWPLLAALLFMFVLVLFANVFSDAVRDAFDPHLREIQEEQIVVTKTK